MCIRDRLIRNCKYPGRLSFQDDLVGQNIPDTFRGDPQYFSRGLIGSLPGNDAAGAAAHLMEIAEGAVDGLAGAYGGVVGHGYEGVLFDQAG